MRKNNVDFEFQFRVRNYLEYCFGEESDKEKEEKIISHFTPVIKEEYKYQIFGRKLLEIPFFKNNFSGECLRGLSRIMKRMDVAPDENLMKEVITK